MTTGQLLIAAWDPSAGVLALTVGSLVVYALQARGRLAGQSPWFVAAVAVLFLALASPIGVLAQGYLFSAHMLQHLLLVLVVPPLALLGLPHGESVPADPTVRLPWMLRYGSPWLAGVGAMWVWHERALCNAAATSTPVRWFQTASLIFLGLAFWRPIFSPRLAERFAPFSAVLYLFSACTACSVLGILLTFSPLEACSAYLHPVDRLGALPLLQDGWGLTPAADQQLGGLMMWVPACFVYGAAILAVMARYYREEGVPAVALENQRETAEVK